MRLSAILIGFSILALSLGAFAASFDITIVEASKEGSGFDAGLGRYKNQLTDMGYKSARIKSSKGIAAGIKESKTFTVAGDVSAQIMPTSISDGFVFFELKLKQGGDTLLTVNYRISTGSHTMIAIPSAKKYIIIIRALD